MLVGMTQLYEGNKRGVVLPSDDVSGMVGGLWYSFGKNNISEMIELGPCVPFPRALPLHDSDHSTQK